MVTSIRTFRFVSSCLYLFIKMAEASIMQHMCLVRIQEIVYRWRTFKTTCIRSTSDHSSKFSVRTSRSRGWPIVSITATPAAAESPTDLLYNSCVLLLESNCSDNPISKCRSRLLVNFLAVFLNCSCSSYSRALCCLSWKKPFPMVGQSVLTSSFLWFLINVFITHLCFLSAFLSPSKMAS